MTATFHSEDEILHYAYPVVLQREILQQQQIRESYTELPEPIKIPSSVICAVICNLILMRLQNCVINLR